MSEVITDPLEYYACPGLMTDPREHADFLVPLPCGISVLCEIVQGLIVHIFWAERYGVALPEERKEEVQLRSVDQMMIRVRELDSRPLTVKRSLERRMVGNCRDFSVLLCAFLRHKGIPARARCGFGTYFKPGYNEDHWICEYWKTGEQRWVKVDAQLDSLQRKMLGVKFNPIDLPSGQFLTGGEAWQLCRTGQAEPEKFGILDMYGMWFIRGNVVRDLLSLNKIEILPWDGWGLIAKEEEDLTSQDIELLDHIADLTIGGNDVFSEVRSIFEEDDRLHMPPNWPP